jgi:hypothetical protein
MSDPTDYSNSHKKRAKQPDEPVDKPKVEAIVTGTVRKRGVGAKIKGIFFGGEFKTAARYVAADVILPAFRNLFVDATTRGVERVVFGEAQQRRSRPVAYGSRINYTGPWQSRPQDRALLPDQRPHSMPRQVRKESNEVVVGSREDADNVMERMYDMLERYEVVSVADLYQLIGHPASHIDNKWGWTQLNNTEIRQVREGYLIDLPPAEEI